MVRTGKTRKKDAAYVSERLRIARGYLKSAQDSLGWAEAGDIGNPFISHSILCAIAYCDALTAFRLGEINQGDHQSVIKLLRAAVGRELPDKQLAHLRALLEEKDEVQYGARAKTLEDARRALERLQSFADWAENALRT